MDLPTHIDRYPVKLLLTAAEACAALSVGRTFLYQLAATGEIQSVKLGHARRFTLQSLEAYVSRLGELEKAS
ncbi:MAG TPA: helix-turn-helix domain-containing protein [Ktedonobacterales bacterium]|jgi:excisionase family DNA binding protein|nr:helix-turn-helix domain-containing protein [Ktedonobacterales bacterium]